MRMPDRESEHGAKLIQAWKLPHTAAMRPEQNASLSAWIVTGPFHPWWKWWQVGVVHLREINGTPEPFKHYPEAEYEFLIVGFNPDRGEPDIDAMDQGKDWGLKSQPKFLSPVEVVVQFHGVTDEQAAEIGDNAAEAIVRGMSPDRDFRQWWQSAIRNSVKHARGEAH